MTLYTHKYLDKLRFKSDILADDVVSEFVLHVSKDDLSVGIQEVFSGNFEKYKDFPVFQEYLRLTSSLPHDTNFKDLEIGRTIFKLYSPEIHIILMLKSLPECYACGNGAKVLYQTGNSKTNNGSNTHIVKRLRETADFVHDLLNKITKEGFSKEAINAIQKTRLIHAFSRYFIIHHKKWDIQKLGIPVNQEDMIGTLMSFSIGVIEGVEKLDVQLKENQKQAYYHTWKIIGNLLGIIPDVLPETYQEGKKLSKAVLLHQINYTIESKELIHSIISTLDEINPIPSIKGIPQSLLHFLVDEEVSKITTVSTPINWYCMLIIYLMRKKSKMKCFMINKIKIFHFFIILVNSICMFLSMSFFRFKENRKGNILKEILP